MISVILVEPETAGNVGSVARAMKNFGLRRLLVVNPQCDIRGQEALSRAMHGRDILRAASAKQSLYETLRQFDYAAGTTARVGTDYNLPRSPITPRQLGRKISALRSRRVALVFGREGRGLSNRELLSCDFTVTIPAAVKYPVLNISHAAAVIFYELFTHARAGKAGGLITPISSTEKKVIMQRIESILGKMEFSSEQKRETQRRLWRRMLGKAMLTKREAFALLGFLRKAEPLAQGSRKHAAPKGPS